MHKLQKHYAGFLLQWTSILCWLKRNMGITANKHWVCSSGTSIIWRGQFWTWPILLLFLMSGLWRIKYYLSKPSNFMVKVFTEYDKW